jgi:hypothetical protein
LPSFLKTAVLSTTNDVGLEGLDGDEIAGEGINGAGDHAHAAAAEQVSHRVTDFKPVGKLRPDS